MHHPEPFLGYHNTLTHLHIYCIHSQSNSLSNNNLPATLTMKLTMLFPLTFALAGITFAAPSAPQVPSEVLDARGDNAAVACPPCDGWYSDCKRVRDLRSLLKPGL